MTNPIKSMIVLKDDHMPKIHIKNNCNIEFIYFFYLLFFTSYLNNPTPFNSFFLMNLIFPLYKRPLDLINSQC